MPLAERIAPRPLADETLLLARLRDGDERAFTELVDRYQPALTSVALRYVGSRSVAEEVVQETWVGLLRGIDGFEGRSSLKTWIFRILVNTAMSRSRGERRCTPFSSLASPGNDEPVEVDRFVDGAGERWHGHWAAAPSDWATVPEERLMATATLAC